MRTFFSHIPLFFLMGISTVNAQSTQSPKSIQAKLNEAIVFFQGAELNHSASANLSKGSNEIIIEGLSPIIDKNSLKIKASNGVIVSSFEFSFDYIKETKTNSLVAKKLQDSIDICNEQLSKLNTEIKINHETLSFLKKGTEKNVSGSEKGLGIDDLIKAMEYYRSKSTELENTQAQNFKKRDKLSNTIDRLNAQLATEKPKDLKMTGVLKLNLSAPIATNCNFTINYYTSLASWTPYYNINVASIDKPINIEMKSKVQQKTGVDWNNVKLTLSSASPSKGQVAPLFNTWFLQPMSRAISRFEMVNEAALQNSYSYEEKAMSALDDAEEEDVPIARNQPMYIVNGSIMSAEQFAQISPDMIKGVTVQKDASAAAIYGARAANGVILIELKDNTDFVNQSDNDLNYVFNIDRPYSIPGNGKEQSIDLAKKEATAEFKYYCAPKLDSQTFLLAEIGDWQKLNLLTGKANITYDGTYVGETVIDANSTSKNLTLTLGADKRVAVKREKMQDYSSNKIFGNDIKKEFTYKITVKNNQNKAIKLVLKDQYPRSTQKNINVELQTKETTPWTANIEETGVITWEEDFKPGESKEYKISYSVKYPKDMQLNL